MKRLGIFIITVFLISSFSLPLKAEQPKPTKIGYVDVPLVFDGYNKTKDQDGILTSKGEQKKQERDKMVEKIKGMKKELELLNDKQKESRQEQVYQEERKLQDFENSVKMELRKERDTMVREILKEIDGAISDYAKKNGYTIIINSRVLLYGQTEDDLTQAILTILNSNYNKK